MTERKQKCIFRVVFAIFVFGGDHVAGATTGGVHIATADTFSAQSGEVGESAKATAT